MGRVINPEGVGKERTRLTKAIVLSIRELMQQKEPDQKTRDLAAFIAMALQAVADTIDQTVTAWEKRDYWIKADRFRMEWSWSQRLGDTMRQAVLEENWALVAATAAQVAEKLQKVKVSKRHRMGTPWEGAWEKLQEQELQSS